MSLDKERQEVITTEMVKRVNYITQAPSERAKRSRPTQPLEQSVDEQRRQQVRHDDPEYLERELRGKGIMWDELINRDSIRFVLSSRHLFNNRIYEFLYSYTVIILVYRQSRSRNSATHLHYLKFFEIIFSRDEKR